MIMRVRFQKHNTDEILICTLNKDLSMRIIGVAKDIEEARYKIRQMGRKHRKNTMKMFRLIKRIGDVFYEPATKD